MADMAIGRLLCHHHLDKLLIIDLSVAIDVSLSDHFIHLLIGQLLAQVGHDVGNSAALMKPFPSRSKTLNASMSSSSVSVSFILRAIKERNSGKSIVPLPSASTSLIMSPC